MEQHSGCSEEKIRAAAAKQVAAGKTACCGGGAELSGLRSHHAQFVRRVGKGGAARGRRGGFARLRQSHPPWRNCNREKTVLDLGSGGASIAAFGQARRSHRAKAYGLDMTDEMLALARENQKKAGAAERGIL